MTLNQQRPAGIAVGAVGMRIYDLRRAASWFELPAVKRRATFLESILAKRLDLSDAQKEKMAALIEFQRPVVDAMERTNVPIRQKLRRELVEKSAEFLKPKQHEIIKRFANWVDSHDEPSQSNRKQGSP